MLEPFLLLSTIGGSAIMNFLTSMSRTDPASMGEGSRPNSKGDRSGLPQSLNSHYRSGEIPIKISDNWGGSGGKPPEKEGGMRQPPSSPFNLDRAEDYFKFGWVYLAVLILLSTVSFYKHIIPDSVLTLASPLILIPLLVKSFQSPILILMALIVYVPYSKEVAGNMTTGINFTTILLVIAILAMTSQRKDAELTESDHRSEFRFRWLIVLFCSLGAFSVLHTDIASGWDIFTTLIDYKRWIDQFLIFFFFSYLVRTEEEGRRLVYLMGVSLIVVGFWSFYHQFDLSQGNHEIRFEGITKQSNEMGAFYAVYLSLPLALLLLKEFGLSRKVLFGTGFAGCIIGLMLTQSRAAALAMAGSIAVFFLMKNRQLFLFVLGAIVFLALNVQYLPRGISERFQNTVVHNDSNGLSSGSQYEASAQVRIIIWNGALRMVADHPFIGVGFNMFNEYIYSYADKSGIEDPGILEHRDPHNGYLKIVTEMGIPTFIVFLLILVNMIRISLKSYFASRSAFWKSISAATTGGVLSLIVVNLFGSHFFSLILTGYLWALMAILLKVPGWAAAEVERENP